MDLILALPRLKLSLRSPTGPLFSGGTFGGTKGSKSPIGVVGEGWVGWMLAQTEEWIA